jgi:hypothetical protein
MATFLLVDLLIGHVGSLGLLLVQEGADPRQRLVANDKDGGSSSLSVGDEACLLVLFDFRVIDLEDVILALETLMVWEEDKSPRILVELLGGLLGDGESLVDAIEGLAAQGVDLLDVRRDILVGLREVGNNGSSEGLVSGFAELDGALAVFVGFEDMDAVADNWVVEQML